MASANDCFDNRSDGPVIAQGVIDIKTASDMSTCISMHKCAVRLGQIEARVAGESVSYGVGKLRTLAAEFYDGAIITNSKWIHVTLCTRLAFAARVLFQTI